MSYSQFIESQIKGFDEFRNDGEHCSIDDSMLNKFDVIMLKDFLRQSLTAQLEWIEKEMPDNLDVIKFGCLGMGYNQALLDIKNRIKTWKNER